MVEDAIPKEEKSMRLRMLLSAGAAVLAGCGGGAALGGGATVMVYAVPDGNPLTYERSDSMAISIEAPGMGSLTLRIDQAMTLGMAFTASAAGVQVTTAVESLSARMTNPLSAPVMLTESDVQGDLVISTDGRGDAELIELPEVSNVGGPAFNVTALANELLPKLPPRGVMHRRGHGWRGREHQPHPRRPDRSCVLYGQLDMGGVLRQPGLR